MAGSTMGMFKRWRKKEKGDKNKLMILIVRCTSPEEHLDVET